ncbi:hypothetical protein SLS60_009796 [Paraconiothyrium brasiliense]|uniref:AA9 family lytic polysaccharide monooxygenase n=1 Tax=Paraconiothyrium brasiliense TaxID=300254 RepID=A0ABR3QT90_9PLEO
MKPSFLATALLIQQAAAHALFQQLWVNGVDKSNTCVRMPRGNSPVSSVSSNDLRCNAGGAAGVSGKCAVNAGDTVTVEMHQVCFLFTSSCINVMLMREIKQPGDRSCGSEAIGGNHYGPVLIYLSKVPDASKADGSAGWFKVYENGWAPAPGNKGAADNDYWGVKDMNKCCGKVDFKIPKELAPGDYLLRAEVVALHTAQSADPGIKINIHSAITGYTVPGPKVIAEGTTDTPGNPVCAKKMIRGASDIFTF